MALTQQRDELRDNVRRFANVQGTTALLRHPDTDLDDYINRALGSLHRRLTVAIPDQRFLASTTVNIEDAVTTYPLPSNFDHLISVDLTVDSRRIWLVAYEMHERPELVSADESFTGVPFAYRLRGSNIEYLPTPNAAYDSLVWYVPTPTQLTGDAQTFDTISRLDDYVIAYAARWVAIKDKNWDLRDACKEIILEFESEIDLVSRGRDKNSPPRIVDVYQANRWGRQIRRRV
jgi:hypothetical protein